jgi:hypothetical protein
VYALSLLGNPGVMNPTKARADTCCCEVKVPTLDRPPQRSADPTTRDALAYQVATGSSMRSRIAAGQKAAAEATF